MGAGGIGGFDSKNNHEERLLTALEVQALEKIFGGLRAVDGVSLSVAEGERRVLIAEAQKTAEIVRGEGDAEAVRIFAEAFGRDTKFFDFYRSLQAYRTAFDDGTTSFVLRPDSPFFRYFGTPPAEVGLDGTPPPPAGPAQSQGPVSPTTGTVSDTAEARPE